MSIHIGGPDCRKIVYCGQFTCALQYIDEEPTALFLASNRNRGPNPPVVAIPLSHVYKWDDEKYVASASMEAVTLLRFEPTASTAYDFACFVNDMLPDLLAMKPLPESMRAKPPVIEVRRSDSSDGYNLIVH